MGIICDPIWGLFVVQYGEHLWSNMGIISRPIWGSFAIRDHLQFNMGIICGPIWNHLQSNMGTVDIIRTRSELSTPRGSLYQCKSLFIRHNRLTVVSPFPLFGQWLIRRSRNKTSSNQRLEQCVVRVRKRWLTKQDHLESIMCVLARHKI